MASTSTSANEEQQTTTSASESEEECPVTDALRRMVVSFAESLKGVREASERRLQEAVLAGGHAAGGVELREASAGGSGSDQQEVLREAEDPWQRMATAFAASLSDVRVAFLREKVRLQQQMLDAVRTDKCENNVLLDESLRTAVSCVFPRVDYLLDEVDKRWPPNSVPQEKALLQAAHEGDLDMVQWLLDEGVNINCRGCSTLRTPLHMAAGRGHAAVVRLLATRGADLNVLSASGHTPLHHAVQLDPSGRCVAELIAAGADVSQDDGSGVTPLRVAKRLRRWEAMFALMRADAE